MLSVSLFQIGLDKPSYVTLILDKARLWIQISVTIPAVTIPAVTIPVTIPVTVPVTVPKAVICKLSLSGPVYLYTRRYPGSSDLRSNRGSST